MSPYTRRKFWTQTAERAIKTFAQTAVAIVGAEAVNVLSVDWLETALVSVTSAIVSVLTSIGSAQIGDRTPSLVDE